MTTAERETLEAGARWFDVELLPAATDRIARFLALLGVWNRRIRLTAETDRKAVIAKHVVDSLALVPFLPGSGTVVDIGSGAGFPGIVLGSVRPDLRLVLIESRRRRASFLRESIRTIPLPAATVLELRAEAAAETERAGTAALVVARAVRLDAFLPLAAPLLRPGGNVLAMQTPRTAGAASRTASASGLRLSQRQDYTLPGGAPRTLLTFERVS
jgi:16S rRNA (guanine527-N7)-methyltransferase